MATFENNDSSRRIFDKDSGRWGDSKQTNCLQVWFRYWVCFVKFVGFKMTSCILVLQFYKFEHKAHCKERSDERRDRSFTYTAGGVCTKDKNRPGTCLRDNKGIS